MHDMPAEMKNACREFTDEAKNGPSLTLVTLLSFWKCAGQPDTYASK